MKSVWGVSAVAILDSSVNCVCLWSTKKLTMLAYCVAANCNNSQTTPGITVHELPHNRPTVRQKWIQFIQFKRAEKSCLACSNWYGCILVGLSGKVSVSSSELKLAILQRLPEWHSRHMVTWFGCHGNAFSTTKNAFFRAFITLWLQFYLHHRSQRALTEIVSKITPNLGLVL